MATPVSTNSKVPSLHHATTIPDGDFLLFLGKRVRRLRNLRGMTRKMVAHESDVSERHLAQLEVGEGNVSIVLLRRIAAALNVSLVELFAPEVEQPSEKLMIQRFLERLPNHRLEDVVFRLMRDFNPGENDRRKRIALIDGVEIAVLIDVGGLTEIDVGGVAAVNYAAGDNLRVRNKRLVLLRPIYGRVGQKVVPLGLEPDQGRRVFVAVLHRLEGVQVETGLLQLCNSLLRHSDLNLIRGSHNRFSNWHG